MSIGNFFSKFETLDGCDLLVCWSEELVNQRLGPNFFSDHLLAFETNQGLISAKCTQSKGDSKLFYLESTATGKPKNLYLVFDKAHYKGRHVNWCKVLFFDLYLGENKSRKRLDFNWRHDNTPFPLETLNSQQKAVGIIYWKLPAGANIHKWNVDLSRKITIDEAGRRRFAIKVKLNHASDKSEVAFRCMNTDRKLNQITSLSWEDSVEITDILIGGIFDLKIQAKASYYHISFTLGDGNYYDLGYPIHFDNSAKIGFSPTSIGYQLYPKGNDFLPNVYLYAMTRGRSLPSNVNIKKNWILSPHEQGTLVLSGKAMLDWFLNIFCQTFGLSEDNFSIVDPATIQTPLPDCFHCFDHKTIDLRTQSRTYQSLTIKGILEQNTFLDLIFNYQDHSTSSQKICKLRCELHGSKRALHHGQIILKWQDEDGMPLAQLLINKLKAFLQNAQTNENEIEVHIGDIKFDLPDKLELFFKNFRLLDHCLVFDISHKN